MTSPNEAKKTEMTFKEILIRLPVFPLAIFVILSVLLLPFAPLFVAVYGLLRFFGI